MRLNDPRNNPMLKMLTPQGQHATLKLFFKYQCFAALLEVFSAMCTALACFLGWRFILGLEVQNWWAFLAWICFTCFVIPWASRRFDGEIQQGLIVEMNDIAQKHLPPGAFVGSNGNVNIPVPANLDKCKVCGRFAPLIDGECPDCRH